MTQHLVRRALATAGALATLAILSGCDLTPDSSEEQSASRSSEVSTTVPKDPVTITLAYADDPPTKALIDGFEKRYPNVTIKPQFTHFNDYVKSIKLAMASEAPPDIAEYNPGAMRSLIPAGLVQNLDAYEEAYKWQDGFPPASLDVLRTDDAAKRFGTGSLYAVPGALSVVGVYYNKELVEKAGIDVPPATLADFEAALGKAKAGGELPLSVGGLDTGALHHWGAVLNVMMPPEDYRDWVYGAPGATIVTDGARQATQTFVDWAKKGYIAKSANGIGEQDSAAAFAKGKGVFHINGNWAAAGMREAMGDNVGFFILPGVEEGAPAVANGASVAWSISSKSEHKDVAAAFLDYMRSAEAAGIQSAGGFMPVDVDAAPPAEGLDGDIAAGFKEVVANDGILPFPDFAAPSMLDVLISGNQGLIAGKTSVDAYLESLQDVWDEHHGGQ
jgi:ABC-type glycerol-3-phosphate transport system substrate-binding protein